MSRSFLDLGHPDTMIVMFSKALVNSLQSLIARLSFMSWYSESNISERLDFKSNAFELLQGTKSIRKNYV